MANAPMISPNDQRCTREHHRIEQQAHTEIADESRVVIIVGYIFLAYECVAEASIDEGSTDDGENAGKSQQTIVVR